jgi:hypothetical protein
MEKPFWSIKDFLDWRGEADLDKALDALLNCALSEQVGLTGQRCSWNRFGADCESDGFSRDILAVDLDDLKFDVLDGPEFVLIQNDRSFDEEPAARVGGEINSYAAGVTWVDKDYDERVGPALWSPSSTGHDRIRGWGKLRLRADRVRAIYTGETPLGNLPPRQVGLHEPLRTRGRTPVKRRAAREKIERAINDGKYTIERLSSEKLEVLATEFEFNRKTFTAALREVLAQAAPNSEQKGTTNILEHRE